MKYALFTAPGFHIEHVEKVLRKCQEDGIEVSRVYAVVPRRSICERAEAALRELRDKVCREFGLQFSEVYINETSVIESVGRLMGSMSNESKVALDLGGGMRITVIYMLLAASALYALDLLKDLRIYCVTEWHNTVVNIPREFITCPMNLYAKIGSGGRIARVELKEYLRALKKACSGKYIYFEPRDIASALGVEDRMARYVLSKLEKLGIVEKGSRRGYRPTFFGEALLEICDKL